MNRLWWVAAGALLLLSVLLRNQALFLASVLLALLALAAHFWAKYCLVNVRYRRRFESKRLFFDEERALDIEIVNAKLLPLAWLRVDDDFPAALELITSRPVQTLRAARQWLISTLSLRPYERVTRRYAIRGVRRGVWSVGPTQMRSGDFFGFDIRRITLDNREDIIVYPRILPVHGLTLPSRHPIGDARSPQRLVDDPLRLMSVRDYTRNDTFRHIHWKATARRQRLQTKVFEPSASQPTAIFVNVDTALHATSQNWALAELAMVAAASVAREVWQAGHALGLYANALGTRGVQRIRVQPRKHPAQLVRVLEALAHVEGRGRWPIETLLQTEAPRLPHGTTLVVISALVPRRLRLTLADLQRKGYAVALITLGAAAESPVADIAHYRIDSSDVDENEDAEAWRTLETLTLRPATERKQPHTPEVRHNPIENARFLGGALSEYDA